MDGQALVDLLVPDRPARVVGLLWDGCNSNSLYSLAAAGELPAVARLLSRGCALTGGAVAEFPSVTLVNHTCALTGVGPGRHGIVNNAYYDRAVAGAAAHQRRADLAPMGGVAGAGRARPSSSGSAASTACVNEPADSGAAYSTLRPDPRRRVSDGASVDGLVAAAGRATDPHASQRVRRSATTTTPGRRRSTRSG